MFQVQFCKFKGVRNWSCCLVLELLSLWTSWRCFWDLTICCCSLLSINMNCPPPALPVSCRGQKNLRKWWIVREFLIILNIWCRNSKLGPPITQTTDAWTAWTQLSSSNQGAGPSAYWNVLSSLAIPGINTHQTSRRYKNGSFHGKGCPQVHGS